MLKRIVFERRLEREVSVNDSFDADKLRILHNVWNTDLYLTQGVSLSILTE